MTDSALYTYSRYQIGQKLRIQVQNLYYLLRYLVIFEIPKYTL